MKLIDATPPRTWVPPIIKTTWWTSVLIMGLFISLNEFIFPVKEEPVAVTAPAPAPPEVRLKNRDGSSKDLPEKHGAPEIVLMSPPPPTKSWTDYGDKIVGWIVALAGAYNLVRRPKKKEE